jgi:predicted dehydrogenase
VPFIASGHEVWSAEAVESTRIIGRPAGGRGTDMHRSAGLRVAVVGCGYWGSKHVRVLQSIDAVRRVVVVDGRQDRLRSIRHSFPGSACFTSLEQALGHVDAVIVATPPSTHSSLALQAIEAGKHVLVEKPLTTRSADARRLIAAAESAGVVLMVGHTFEYSPAVWKLRELVRSGSLGDIYYVDTQRLNLGLYQSDINVVFDLAPHDVSIINTILGQAPVAVQAWGSRHANRSFEDVAYLRLIYADSELSSNIHVSWLDPCKVRRVTAVGSKKMAVYDDLASEERIRIHDKSVFVPAEYGGSGDQNLTLPPTSYRYGDIVAPFLATDEPLAVEDGHFVDCVRTGKRPLTDGLNGLAVVEVLECAQLSLLLGRPVALDDVRSGNGNGNGGPGLHQNRAVHQERDGTSEAVLR